MWVPRVHNSSTGTELINQWHDTNTHTQTMLQTVIHTSPQCCEHGESTMKQAWHKPWTTSPRVCMSPVSHNFRTGTRLIKLWHNMNTDTQIMLQTVTQTSVLYFEHDKSAMKQAWHYSWTHTHTHHKWHISMCVWMNTMRLGLEAVVTIPVNRQLRAQKWLLCHQRHSTCWVHCTRAFHSWQTASSANGISRNDEAASALTDAGLGLWLLIFLTLHLSWSCELVGLILTHMKICCPWCVCVSWLLHCGLVMFTVLWTPVYDCLQYWEQARMPKTCMPNARPQCRTPVCQINGSHRARMPKWVNQGPEWQPQNAAHTVATAKMPSLSSTEFTVGPYISGMWRLEGYIFWAQSYLWNGWRL